MGAIFSRRANLVALLSLLLAFVLVASIIAVAIGWSRSSLFTHKDVPVDQPIPFSHAHHVHEVGLDCRFCHQTVMVADFAGIPSTETCMNCHWAILPKAPILAPVHESWRSGRAIHWNRVYVIPGYVYFAHSVHLAKGIGCGTCHGRIDRMRLTAPSVGLHMKWCLGCHKDPIPNIRPRSELFNLTWQPTELTRAEHERLAVEYDVQTLGLTDCYQCHR